MLPYLPFSTWLLGLMLAWLCYLPSPFFLLGCFVFVFASFLLLFLVGFLFVFKRERSLAVLFVALPEVSIVLQEFSDTVMLAPSCALEEISRTVWKHCRLPCVEGGNSAPSTCSQSLETLLNLLLDTAQSPP